MDFRDPLSLARKVKLGSLVSVPDEAHLDASRKCVVRANDQQRILLDRVAVGRPILVAGESAAQSEPRSGDCGARAEHVRGLDIGRHG